MSRTPDFYRRDSAIDPAEAAEVPSRAPGRARRLTVTAVIAGGLVLGGTAIAYAGTTTAPTSGDSSSTTSPSQPANPSSAATQRPTPRPHIDGTVASVSGATITVTDPEGFTRTIVTSSSTTYDNGLSAPLATGAEIHATGTVDANHTSLDATQIGTRPTPPAGPNGKDGPRPPMPPAAGQGGQGPQDGQQNAGPGRRGAPTPPDGSAPSGTSTPSTPAAPSTTGGS
jgi:hypothetical protein